MKKQYVPKTLTEFLTESNSITLKRKYGERPTITVGVHAPLRNQVLSFIAENASVSKRDLKQFILGLREGGSTVAAANMFIKRNSKYFITESRNGVTYFKLSDLGQRLVNQFVPVENGNVSESIRNVRKSLSTLLESSRKRNRLNENFEDDEELEDDTENDELEDFRNIEDDIEFEDEEGFEDDKDSAEDIEFEDDRFSEDFDEEDESIESIIAELEEKIAELKAKLEEDEDEEDEDEEDEEFEDRRKFGKFDKFDVGDEFDEEDMDDDLEDEENVYEEFDGRPKIDPKDLEFDKDSVLDNDDEAFDGSVFTQQPTPQEFEDYVEDIIDTYPEYQQAAQDALLSVFDQYPSMHAEVGQIRGRNKYQKGLQRYMSYYGRKFDFAEDIDEAEKIPQFSTHKLTGKKSTKFGGRYSKKEYHNLLDDDENKDNSDIDSIEKELTENEAKVSRMKGIIENLRSKKNPFLYEAEEDDELSDDDITDIDLDDDINDVETADTDTEEVEKVEITEFIITVDDPDAAIEELEELGVNAERVPIEAPAKEVPMNTEEDDLDLDADPAEGEDIEATDDEEQPSATESLKAFFNKTYLNEEESEEEEAGASDELGLGDQGADAAELDEAEEDPIAADEEGLPATTEFEENKIKVNAEDWDTLKGWLEEKGVDVKEMFGGDIETEEFDEDEDASNIGNTEVSDQDIDFSGIGDDDDTKIDDDKEE